MVILVLALDFRAFVAITIYYISLALKAQLFCSIHLYSSSATKYQTSSRENLHSLVQAAIIKNAVHLLHVDFSKVSRRKKQTLT